MIKKLSKFLPWFSENITCTTIDSNKPPENPDSPDSIITHAEKLLASEMHEEAILWLEENLYVTKENYNIAILLHKLLIHQKRMEEADDILNIATSLLEDNPEFLAYCGEYYLTQEKLEIAKAIFEKSKKINDKIFASLLGLSQIFAQEQKYEPALDYCEQALEIDPESRSALRQKALLLYHTGRYKPALDLMDLCADQHMIHGFRPSLYYYTCLLYLGRLEQAGKMINSLLRSNPNDPTLHYAKSNLLLMQQNFDEGWDEYQHRTNHDLKSLRPIPLKPWKGESLNGKNILISIEQGLGDQIMFSSCIQDILALSPKKVYIESHLRISDLFERSFPTCKIIPTGQTQNFSWADQIPVDTRHIQLGDLPRFFRRKLSDFSNKKTPYLIPSESKKETWKKILGNLKGGIKIGFSWKGGTEQTRSFIRSLSPGDLAGLFNLPNITWVSLQYGATETEIQSMPNCSATGSIYFPENVGSDLDEFAALISELDLVISVCNTTIHMSGALSVPCWVMTPKIPEWRYGLTDCMPWYPSVELFRQTSEGDWTDVLASLYVRLQTASGQKQQL